MARAIRPGCGGAVQAPAPGPPLLIDADSFGDEIARNFLEQFGEVWHVMANKPGALSPNDRQALAAFLKARFQSEKILIVYHDPAAISGFMAIDDLFWPAPPRAASDHVVLTPP